ERMQHTRGAVMSLASFSDHYHTLTWLGVGNVEGVLLRANTDENQPDENILMRGGVVGFRLPHLQALVVDVSPGDLLIFATDGIRPGFAKDLRRTDPPQRIADHICAKYSTGNDDSLVLVARYVGSGRPS
ncbi:MAG: SpoIIE family protein phosphatase, partial [Acidobacteria bacterium]|nr:SpoIIE family protein phosphatase [Acidobacteriota bacterium]